MSVVYRFNMVSNILVYDFSEVVLIHLFVAKTKKGAFRSQVVLI